MFSSLRAALVVSAAIAANLTVTDDTQQAEPEAVLQGSDPVASVNGKTKSIEFDDSMMKLLSDVGLGRKGVFCLPITDTEGCSSFTFGPHPPKSGEIQKADVTLAERCHGGGRGTIVVVESVAEFLFGQARRCLFAAI